MSEHTPGPWTPDAWADISTNRNGNPTLVARALQRCADLPSHPIRKDEAEANARLIAAAPDMLAALKEVLRCSALPDHWAGPVRAAIAKAEGVS